ncbi:hypothetical protein FTX61_01860 [Nitriliruptoraceae bacterium ZYF776]|nr:hypothetical protein [Profundirhabdus halotolerans]
MLLSLWRVPLAGLPAHLADVRPEGVEPVPVRGAAVVGTAFVHYAPGSVLTYEELLAAVLTHRGTRLRVTIPDIWVDSPASRDGGRELWGIPKGLARFHRSARGRRTQVRADLEGGPVAVARFTRTVALPGWHRLPLPTAQRLDGRDHDSRVQSLARLHLATAAWRFAPTGPLGWLAGRRPLLSVVLDPMSVTFGLPR